MSLNKYGYSNDGYKSIELIKNTKDDWKPNLPGDKIKVRVSFRPNATFQIFTVYICAIGASNYRYELEYQTEMRESAEEKYKEWTEFLHSLPDEVDKKLFEDLGIKEKTE
jgi:hypothetical protein